MCCDRGRGREGVGREGVIGESEGHGMSDGVEEEKGGG